jgi:hypothetical protein
MALYVEEQTRLGRQPDGVGGAFSLASAPT